AADGAKTAAALNFKIDGLDLAATGLSNYVPDMSGILALSGNCQSDGNAAQLKGTIKAEKLKLSKIGTPAAIPAGLDFDVQHLLQRHSGQIRRGAIHTGKSTANLTGTYGEQGQDMIV